MGEGQRNKVMKYGEGPRRVRCPWAPNVLATPLVSKVRKKLSPEGGRKGGWGKKARAARPPDPWLEPGTCRVLGEGPQLHARGIV